MWNLGGFFDEATKCVLSIHNPHVEEQLETRNSFREAFFKTVR